MSKFTLRSFRLKVHHRKKSYNQFLNRIKRNPPQKLDMITEVIDKEVWKEMDCLSCGNCCKEMSPTYTVKDIKRISAHLNLTEKNLKINGC